MVVHVEKTRWLAASGLALALVVAACSPSGNTEVQTTVSAAQPASEQTTIQSLIPEARLAKIKQALPKVYFPKLKSVFNSSTTLWYDHEVMTPSYQDSVGVNSNADWPRLVARTGSTNRAIRGLHDAQTKRWQFPFAATAGTDHSSNTKVVNFISLPHENGKPLSIPIWTIRRNANRPSWMWHYPIGTMVGEVIFIKSGDKLLPAEVRTRQRFANDWGTNVFRPFPTAKSLSKAIKKKRSNWQRSESLSAMVDHLEDNSTLRRETVVAKDALRSTFERTAGADTLPAFGDDALVEELLTTTPFVSAFGRVWKRDGDLKSFAPTTTSNKSIVPNNYQAHMLEVNDASCKGCHQDAGRRVSEFYDGLYLYGEIWGKDGVFSFHPFDEGQFNRLRRSGAGPDGYVDNRRINPQLERMGVFERYNAAKHDNNKYPQRQNP